MSHLVSPVAGVRTVGLRFFADQHVATVPAKAGAHALLLHSSVQGLGDVYFVSNPEHLNWGENPMPPHLHMDRVMHWLAMSHRSASSVQANRELEMGLQTQWPVVCAVEWDFLELHAFSVADTPTVGLHNPRSNPLRWPGLPPGSWEAFQAAMPAHAKQISASLGWLNFQGQVGQPMLT